MAADKMTVTQFIDQIYEEFRDKPVSRELIDKVWWTCFATYLDREVRRHENDSNRGMREVKYLDKLGYKSLYIPADFWIKLPK